jgi:hypothetical protein
MMSEIEVLAYLSEDGFIKEELPNIKEFDQGTSLVVGLCTAEGN